MADTSRFVTPYKYAQLCGVSATAINRRIERGQLEVMEMTNPIDGTSKRYIDTSKFPVEQTKAELRNYPAKLKKKE